MIDLSVFDSMESRNLFGRYENVVPKKEVDDWIHDKTYTEFISLLLHTNSPFLSELKTEDEISLPDSIRSTIISLSNDLNFSQDVQSDIHALITKFYIDHSRENIHLSKSKEGEFLAYITSNGAYRNLLVDEDGDIELLIIPADKTKTHSRRFYKEDGVNFSDVVRALNEMS